jgi:hypothetical protein
MSYMKSMRPQIPDKITGEGNRIPISVRAHVIDHNRNVSVRTVTVT